MANNDNTEHRNHKQKGDSGPAQAVPLTRAVPRQNFMRAQLLSAVVLQELFDYEIGFGQTPDDLTAKLLLIVLSGHTSGLHAAGMRRYIPACWTDQAKLRRVHRQFGINRQSNHGVT